MSFPVHTVSTIAGGAAPNDLARLRAGLFRDQVLPASAASLTVLGSITAGTGYTVLPTLAVSGGTLTAGSTDAVNGSQLWATNEQVAALNSIVAGISASSTYFRVNSSSTAASATGTNATSVGTGAKASGSNATAIGSNATASGSNAIAVGTSSVASADGAIAIGTTAASTGTNAIAIGTGATATGSVAVGVEYG